IIVPIMVPDFVVERRIGYAEGVMGANFWYLCSSKKAVKEAGMEILKAISQVEGVVTPFDICSAGSKPETNYPWIGPSTNHYYCPSLKDRLGAESKVPDGVGYIPEVVINGVSLEAVKEAMRAGIEAALNVDGVVKISAGNYQGKLGRHIIPLRELIE
ncbi:MAG: formylmethanofuran--tetrahydromethanopterin N-formyltransferase, partial [Candidatus Bathyarchaeia archaeon]